MKKLGIALAGGGARGAYQIGAWQALREAGIDTKIEAFSGASVGSLNAVLFAMGDYDLAKDTWMSLHKDTLFKLEKNIFKRILDEKLDIVNQGIYNTQKLEDLLKEKTNFEMIKDKEVYIATTHLGNEKGHFLDLIKTNYKHYFKSEKQIVYKNLNHVQDEDKINTLLASCAIPVAFQPVKIGLETFYDGGLLNNTPYQPLIEAGCDVIIIIDLFTFSPLRLKKIDDAKVYVCYPKRSLRGILDFNNKHINRRFEFGYNDMKKLLEKIKDELI